jgi:hypothetical protein
METLSHHLNTTGRDRAGGGLDDRDGGRNLLIPGSSHLGFQVLNYQEQRKPELRHTCTLTQPDHITSNGCTTIHSVEPKAPRLQTKTVPTGRFRLSATGDFRQNIYVHDVDTPSNTATEPKKSLGRCTHQVGTWHAQVYTPEWRDIPDTPVTATTTTPSANISKQQQQLASTKCNITKQQHQLQLQRQHENWRFRVLQELDPPLPMSDISTVASSCGVPRHQGGRRLHRRTSKGECQPPHAQQHHHEPQDQQQQPPQPPHMLSMSPDLTGTTMTSNTEDDATIASDDVSELTWDGNFYKQIQRRHQPLTRKTLGKGVPSWSRKIPFHQPVSREIISNNAAVPIPSWITVEACGV